MSFKNRIKNLFSRDSNLTLRTKTFSDIKEFIIQGSFVCKVLRIYDADTLWVSLKFNGKIYKISCRLLGIDANEMPRSHSDAMQDYYVQSYQARDRVVDLVTNCDLQIIKANNCKITDNAGTPLPSLSDKDLQTELDKNTLLVRISLQNGTDKYGRYLAHIFTRDNADVSNILLDEGLAKPYT